MPATGTDTFTPGDYWTPARAREAVASMLATMESPQFAAVLESGPADDNPVFDEILAEARAQHVQSATLTGPERCRYRRARPADVAAVTALVASADMPPFFIEEFVRGFVVVEHGDEIIACAGLELYEDTAVIRSVVVDERARGWGLGRRMSELLIEDARLSGASEVYLWTADALPFWRHLGFEEVDMDIWPEHAKPCWQWQYIDRNRGMLEGVHSMRMPLAPR